MDFWLIRGLVCCWVWVGGISCIWILIFYLLGFGFGLGLGCEFGILRVWGVLGFWGYLGFCLARWGWCNIGFVGFGWVCFVVGVFVLLSWVVDL